VSTNYLEVEWEESICHVSVMDVVMTLDDDLGFHLRLRDCEDEHAGWYTVVGTSPDYSIVEQHHYRQAAREALGIELSNDMNIRPLDESIVGELN